MRSNIRGILVFLLAFLIGTAAVFPPIPEISEIPAVSDEYQTAKWTMDCSLISEPETGRQNSHPFTIDIRRRTADSIFDERSIAVKPGLRRVTNIYLELGENIENELLVLRSAVKQTFKIEMQHETSMAIGDEGPHIDLVDWKHYTSPWRTIKPGVGGVDDNKYLVPQIPEAEFTRFPSVTTKEIVAALRKTGAEKRWLNLARTCTGPNRGPCYVSTSRISIRISVKQNTGWKIAHTLNFSIPMGC